MDTKMNGTTRLKIGDLNKNLICVLCGGYLIDATTIIECLHSFCRTCIVTFLKSSRTCPVCDTVVHKTRPHQNIRSDKLLQDLVYKLVPGLYKDEMRRRREFYTAHYEAAPKRAGEERGDEMSDRFTFTEEESISLALYLCPDGGNERFGFHRVFTTKEDMKTRMDKRIKESVDVRYLQCKAAVTVGILKKFLRLKYSLPEHFQIAIFYNDEPLRNCYTLCDIAYIFNWRRRAPLLMTFCVYEGSKPYKKLLENESCPQALTPPSSGQTEVKIEPVETANPSFTGDITKPSSPSLPAIANTTNEPKLVTKITNEAQEKSSVKSAKSKEASSKYRACLTTSETSQLHNETSSSSTTPDTAIHTSSSSITTSTLLPSLTQIKAGTSKTKKSAGDKRKLVTSEASESKKRRKVSQEPPKDLISPSQPATVSSSQTLPTSSKSDTNFHQINTSTVTVFQPVVSYSVSLACNNSAATVTKSMSQAKLSSSAHSSTLPSTTPTLSTSTLTQPIVTCTVAPSRTMPTHSPSVNNSTMLNHSQYTSTQISSKITMTPSTRLTPAQISKLYTSSAASYFQMSSLKTSTPTQSQSIIPPFATTTVTTTSYGPTTMAPSLSTSNLKFPSPKCTQKVKPNIDFENHGKNRNSSLGKRSANTPIPIAPAPTKLQIYNPSSVEVSRMMKLEPGIYASLHQSINTVKQTTACPTSTSLSVKSAKSTTLKFSVSSLLSATPGKSSLVSMTQNNKPVSTASTSTSSISTTDAIVKSISGHLLVQPGVTKSKVSLQGPNVSRPQKQSSGPILTQSVQSLQNNRAVSFDSAVTVSSQSIGSPTPASSASPTPEAVPPQQSQTQGSDVVMITSIKQEPELAEKKIIPPSLVENTSNNINKSNGKTCTKDTSAASTNSIQDKKGSRTNVTANCQPQNVALLSSEYSTSQPGKVSLSPPLTPDSRLSSSSSVLSSGSPEQNCDHKLPSLSPTGSNGSACPSRKQASTQKKKIADIANTLLQNQNSKSPQMMNISNTRKNLQNTASNNKNMSLPLIKNEYYMGVVNGQSLHNMNKCSGAERPSGNMNNAESDEPLNLVKKKDAARLPNSIFILDVPTNIQGHKQLK